MPQDPATRRKIGLIVLVAVVILFIVELVALALGQGEIATAVFAIFVIGWFVLRSWMKRTGQVSK